MSIWEPSTLVPRVAELQDASRSSDEVQRQRKRRDGLLDTGPACRRVPWTFAIPTLVGVTDRSFDDRYVPSVRDRNVSRSNMTEIKLVT